MAETEQRHVKKNIYFSPNHIYRHSYQGHTLIIRGRVCITPRCFDLSHNVCPADQDSDEERKKGVAVHFWEKQRQSNETRDNKDTPLMHYNCFHVALNIHTNMFWSACTRGLWYDIKILKWYSSHRLNIRLNRWLDGSFFNTWTKDN